MKHSSQTNYRKSVFTMLEAAIAIAVIGILSYLLMPMLKSVKSSAYRPTCEFNLMSVGMALKSYADDYDVYPLDSNIVSILSNLGYLKQGPDYKCPLDKSALGNTYTYGYVAGHPATMKWDDPLVVCGWHPRVGSLAVFSDTLTDVLSERQGNETYPVSMYFGDEVVEPGFVLNNDNPLVISSEDGSEALVYGEGGAYFISAAYDPFGMEGDGLFTMSIGYDEDGADGDWQDARAHSDQYVKFYTRFQYATVEIVSDPAESDSSHGTKLQWKPHGTHNHIKMRNTYEYNISHRYTGEYEAENEPNNNKTYAPDPLRLETLIPDL